MPDHIEAIQRRLEGMIAEAESRISGNGSILSYGMKIRRDTADEILGFVKSLARTAATDAPAWDLDFDSVQTEPSARRPSLGMQKRNAERFDAQSISPPLNPGAPVRCRPRAVVRIVASRERKQTYTAKGEDYECA